ncbi:MAG TPA: YcgN family cysteine cluster protein [Gammaproteobacteria bacterium]|nr:YcgN family cysteine cluster protein [Gammaproteobacteria bacterium]
MSTTFWKDKKLDQLSDEEWESLCDGCGRCCLHKLEDTETNDLHYTNIACKSLDLNTCRCNNYEDRFEIVPDCITLRQDLYQTIKWLPRSCAYRILAEGKELPQWHPLVSSRKDSVEQAGISVRKIAICEDNAKNWQQHIIDDF